MKNKGWKRQGSVPGAVLFWIRFCLAWIWAGSCAISGAAAAYGAESLPYRTEETPTAETLTLEGPVFTDAGQAQELKEILERDGKQYRLVSRRIRQVSQGGTMTYASVTVPYVLEGRQEPPETARVTLTDEQTGQEYEREIPKLETEETSAQWTGGFQFLITVSGYDADVFQLGNVEIPKDAELSSYGTEFLEYLGLPEECYRVENVEWSGETYEKEGILCRDARATGEKLVRNVEVRYGGQVKTPEVKGKQYIGLYEEIRREPESSQKEEESQGTEIETEKMETLPHEDQKKTLSAAEKFLYWIKKHLTKVVFGTGFFILILGGTALLWMSRRREKRESESPDKGPGS